MEPYIKKERTIVEVVNSYRTGIRYLFSRWLFILLVAFVVGLLGILTAWLLKPTYIARMSFVTETESKGGINAYASIAAQFGIDLGGNSNSLFEGENLIELLKSKNLVIQTLLTPTDSRREWLMINEYLKIRKDDNAHKINFSEYGVSINRQRDSIILKVAKSIIKNDLSISKRDKKLSMIDIDMSSKNENFAKRFCELLAANAIRYYTEYKVKKSRQNVAILEKQTDSVRRMLYGNIGDVATINDLNVNPARQILRSGSQRKQVDLQANTALYVELVKNLELSRLSLRKETPLIQIVDTPVLPLEQKGFGRLLGGIVGGFIGGMLAIFYLLVRRWYRTQQNNAAI